VREPPQGGQFPQAQGSGISRQFDGIVPGRCAAAATARGKEDIDTSAQQEAMIAPATGVMVEVLNKDPEATFVVIDEMTTDHRATAPRRKPERDG
jgi:phenylpyruvate tautomerase PptA (4-oxalocrotonate tautomerase family)